MKLEFYRPIFEKYPNIKFYLNPSSRRTVFPCARTEGQTHMTKLIVAFQHFAKAFKNVIIYHRMLYMAKELGGGGGGRINTFLFAREKQIL
jgi:hypothetical protein